MVGKVAFEANSDDVALSGSAAARNQLGSHVKAQHYFDLSATYTLCDMVNLRAGVNNIFDKSPPIIPTGSGSCPSAACTGNTYPQTLGLPGPVPLRWCDGRLQTQADAGRSAAGDRTAAAASGCSGDDHLPGWPGDPGQPELPGASAAASAAGSGARARSVSDRAS